MEHLNHGILLGGFLIVVSILAGMFSSRLGAPLLLVFLGLGMLAGEDGPGGIAFGDFQVTYLVGSVALAIVLFDGALRTPRQAFRLALKPALVLATVGVAITASIIGALAWFTLDLPPVGSFLVGAVVASTDAAAVFLLLNMRGTELNKRVTATLEVESGINDPMAVFLTVACVEYLLQPAAEPGLRLAIFFAIQMLGGAAIGIAGGFALVWLVNRAELAGGLYPVLCAAFAITVFAAAQSVEASGFLAVYLAGLVLGNKRHRAQATILRFHDGLAWIAQIVMFLMLGLLVTPSKLVANIGPALAIGVVLILVARPLAVFACLAPARFDWREKAFIAWVGLRGAVPIFLASIPVLAGVTGGMTYFNVAFVAVIASLVVQGWTVGPAARFLGLALPPQTEQIGRSEIDLPLVADRDAASWRVAERSPALDKTFANLPLPRRARIIAVIREGAIMNRQELDRLLPDDQIIALVPPEHTMTLDKLFAPRPVRRKNVDDGGEFEFPGSLRLDALCLAYGLPFDPFEAEVTLADYLAGKLGPDAVEGDRVRMGPVELVAREIVKGRATRVGLELEAPDERLPVLRALQRLRRRLFGAR
ncbi:MAG: potassium/proton antiporter [Alphaproteobacteria bacterium]|nr:potassium/proton antiporter [Alphaproteobacteria bacterium]